MKKSRGGIAKWILVALMAVQTVFLVLRIVRMTGWPWIWVLAPIWVPAAAAGVIISIVILIAAFRDRWETRKRRKWH